MAHTSQARKRIRQDEARNAANRAARSRLRTTVKKSETAIAEQDKPAVATTFKNVMSELHRAARKGLISRGSANRKISRLAARIAKGNAA